MGEKMYAVNLNETDKLLAYCPHCGVGLKFDFNKPLDLVLLGCVCGKTFPGAFREMIIKYSQGYQAAKQCDYQGEFLIKCE
ncbi:MAG: hypothetical protein LBR56_00715 [Sporomusaceae bacterium]|jgi:hypothetical protein|nr:hypothetical protein [Sporomusaceae bacterium]